MFGRTRLALAVVLALIVPASAAYASDEVQPRVVGGQATTIEEYPWQAAIAFSPAKRPGGAFQRQFCGGTLLTASIVITAGHCIATSDPDCSSIVTCAVNDSGGDGTRKLDGNDVTVILGRTTLSNDGQGDEVAARSHLDAVSLHPAYSDIAVPRNDAGYIVLQSPVDPDAAIQTIDLAGPDEAQVWAPGANTEVSGWGATSETGAGSDTLRAATVPVIADSSCSSPNVYGGLFDPTIMVCAGYLSGSIDSCFGDSGGPLQAPLQDGGYRLVGLTGWGFGCARANAPGVYTRVAGSKLRPEIEAKVEGLESTFNLADETIVGSGGQPRSGEPKYPPPAGTTSGGGSTSQPATATPVSSTAEPTNPFAKCKRAKTKRKQKLCNRKVRALLGQ